MLHYSNASSIEENRRYLVIKGGACLVALARERGVVGGVVDHRGISIVTGLPERRGGRNSKYIASKCITGQQAELDVF